MGVHSGGKLLYQLAGLSLGQVCSVARKRAVDAGRPGAAAAAGDISWLCYKNHKPKIAETVRLITAFILAFVDEGLIFYAAFDPDSRHHTKKASVACEFA